MNRNLMKSDNGIVKGSISDIAKEQDQTIAESFINADAVILVDTSGSMETPDSANGNSRYSVACDELAKLQSLMPGKIAVISFSNTTVFCPNGKPTYFGNNTNLSGALRFAQVADTIPGMRFIIISDGEPDSESKSLKAASEFKNKIDVIYVGSESLPRGRAFLTKLSQISGGKTITSEKAVNLLESAKVLLLDS